MSEKERVDQALDTIHNDRVSIVDDKRDKDYRQDDLIDAEDEENEDKMVELYRSKRVLSRVDEEDSSQVRHAEESSKYGTSEGVITQEQYGMFTTP